MLGVNARSASPTRQRMLALNVSAADVAELAGVAPNSVENMIRREMGILPGPTRMVKTEPKIRDVLDRLEFERATMSTNNHQASDHQDRREDYEVDEIVLDGTQGELTLRYLYNKLTSHEQDEVVRLAMKLSLEHPPAR